MREIKLIYVIKEICKKTEPGKKALQKLLYFLQEKGFNLGYNYGIHYYGPYCPLVESDIQKLELDGVVIREMHGNSLIMKPSECLDLYLDDIDNINFTAQEREALDFVLTHLCNKTPMQLELLSTVHFVAKEEFQKKKEVNFDKIIRNVEDIKGNKFSENEIRKAIAELQEYNLI